MAKFKLEIFDSDSEELYQILGISEERADSLVEIAKEAYKNHKVFCNTLIDIVSQVTNINELVFVVLLAGRIHDQANNTNDNGELELYKSMVELLKLKAKLNERR